MWNRLTNDMSGGGQTANLLDAVRPMERLPSLATTWVGAGSTLMPPVSQPRVDSRLEASTAATQYV